MSRHRLINDIFEAPHADGGRIITGSNTVPTDATAGYHPGCLYLDLDGGIWYQNVGTLASCAFKLVVTDSADTITDPGDAGAIPVTKSGSCSIVTAGAETRTLAIPTFLGQKISLGFKTDGGDAVVTVATAANQTGNNTLTFADAGDQVSLIAIYVGSALAWRIVCNDGAALSTV